MEPHANITSRQRTWVAVLTGIASMMAALDTAVISFLVLGAIGLIAVPAMFALIRRDELTHAVAKTAVREAQPALAGSH